ncbi:MAG: hypothetical protein IJ976_06445, partial [Alistipes sp.]|nr:hypothetical protein [Alistipes sp.]
MKKLIYTLAVVVCAAALVACGGSNKSTYKKGSKSQLDSLSYAFGVNIGNGITYDMPDLKLDWEVMCDAMEKVILAPVPTGEDTQQEEARAILDEFFRGPRMERMNAKAAEIIAGDSTRQLVREDFVDFDVFAGDDVQRKEISEAYGSFMAVNFRNSRLPLHTYWIKQAIKDYVAGNAIMTESYAQALIQNYYISE